jgi:hypothetical protein
MTEDTAKFRMTIDFPRRDKTSVAVKFTACGNTKEEFEENFAYLKKKALFER